MACAESCPSGALAAVGREMTVEEIAREIEKDKPFFRTSGGGATLSGGEPTLFLDFTARLAGELKKRGIHVLLETCGHFSLEAFTRRLYPALDMIYIDIKIIDPSEHRRLCGVSNDVILKNVEELHRRALAGGVGVLPRVPLIPGLTATDENLTAVARFLGGIGAGRVALLQNNPLWFDKNAMLGRAVEAENDEMRRWIGRERMEEIRSIFRGFEMA
jgi:pyruvate formate lyase activating enzyme